ncbi:MAG TPA: DUF362 domain-containing protein [Desulfomonilaceae bacterium]|nr:DUF362 domain-containing protein [Desulfomonilaceae bacterium]
MIPLTQHHSVLSDFRTAVWRGSAVYPNEPPFHPRIAYPEYALKMTGSEANPSYEGIRECLRMLDLDGNTYGTEGWNPLKGIVRPADTVVIKPNFVLSSHSGGGDLFSIITHPSMLRAIIDYVHKALEGQGRIIIADAPQMDCNFRKLSASCRLGSIQELYSKELGFSLEVLDLRDFWLDARPGDTAAYSSRRIPLPGDPSGSVQVDLGKDSAFYGTRNWRAFYGADYCRDETQSHHHDEIHRYIIAKTVLDADVFISVPKLKVHKKVGATLNAKGLVGITTNKNCLVHYTLGTPETGGDQFPPNMLTGGEKMLVRAQRFLYDALLSKKSPLLDMLYHFIAKTYKTVVQPTHLFMKREKRMLDAGNWYGNDTAWRMISDLMHIIVYADGAGRMRETPQRRILSFIDGIVGGENDGPLAPDAVASGVVLAGLNPLAVDVAATRLMGLDINKLKWIENLLKSSKLGIRSPSEIKIISAVPEFRDMFETSDPLLAFRPHPGWKGHLEL